jgi:hypothetical protein
VVDPSLLLMKSTLAKIYTGNKKRNIMDNFEEVDNDDDDDESRDKINKLFFFKKKEITCVVGIHSLNKMVIY